MKLSRYHVVTRALRDELTSASLRVLFSTRSAKACVVDDGTWRAIAGCRVDELMPDARKMLIDMHLLVDDTVDELQEVVAENREAIQSSDDYYLVIQPTALCQLGCDYCGQKHTPDFMSQQDRDALVERSAREVAAGRFRSFSVCWFGGEPLLAMPVMRDLSRRLRDIARQAGCSYEAKLVSNGLSLNPGLARELVEDHGVTEIELTLDGDPSAHDVRRSKASGAPTFGRIFENLKQLAATAPAHVDINVRCNVDRRNADSCFALADRLAEAGFQQRITFYLASVYSWGNNAHRLALSPDEFAELELRLLAHLSVLGFRLHLLPRRKRIVCLAVSPNSKVVDAFGQIYNCTEVSFVPAYGTPNVYAEGTLGQAWPSEKADSLRKFDEHILDGALPCYECRMLPVCGGSCPKKWFEGHVPCPSNKINIEGKLLLALASERMANLSVAEMPERFAMEVPAFAATGP